MRAIPLELAKDASTPHVEIDGDLVARKLGLQPAEFRQLMEDRKVTVLCERGVGEDEGLYRATFYHRERRFRAVLEPGGRIVHSEP